jgi:hypothetical protein
MVAVPPSPGSPIDRRASVAGAAVLPNGNLIAGQTGDLAGACLGNHAFETAPRLEGRRVRQHRRWPMRRIVGLTGVATSPVPGQPPGAADDLTAGGAPSSGA